MLDLLVLVIGDQLVRALLIPLPDFRRAPITSASTFSRGRLAYCRLAPGTWAFLRTAPPAGHVHRLPGAISLPSPRQRRNSPNRSPTVLNFDPARRCFGVRAFRVCRVRLLWWRGLAANDSATRTESRTGAESPPAEAPMSRLSCRVYAANDSQIANEGAGTVAAGTIRSDAISPAISEAYLMSRAPSTKRDKCDTDGHRRNSAAPSLNRRKLHRIKRDDRHVRAHKGGTGHVQQL